MYEGRNNMRKKFLLYMLILSTLLLTGCARQNTEGTENPSGISSDLSQTTDRSRIRSQTTPENTDSNAMISKEEAQNIAITHAALTREQVTFTKSNLDKDDGREKYEIEFHTHDWKEYDYDIDPYSGQILGYDWDEDVH